MIKKTGRKRKERRKEGRRSNRGDKARRREERKRGGKILMNFYLSYKTHLKNSFLFEAFLCLLATSKDSFLWVVTVLFPYL